MCQIGRRNLELKQLNRIFWSWKGKAVKPLWNPFVCARACFINNRNHNIITSIYSPQKQQNCSTASAYLYLGLVLTNLHIGKLKLNISRRMKARGKKEILKEGKPNKESVIDHNTNQVEPTAGWSSPSVFSLIVSASWSKLAASLYLFWSLQKQVRCKLNV